MSLLLMLWLSVVPKNTILVKGAMPSASDASTPLPEQGSVAAGRYRNAYFGLTYPIPAGWNEQPAGPPPSDGGSYVLTLFAGQHASVLVSAQDLFFGARAAGTPAPRYELEGPQDDVTIAARPFHRLAYGSPRSGLHWRILSTEVRCHALTFTFTGTDTAALDAAEQALSGLSLSAAGPPCLADYAQNALEKTDPLFTTHHYNRVPVRMIVDKDGHVKHIHLLSAFPEQSQAILDALRAWRFKPYRQAGRAVEVETGVMFGAH